MNASRTMMTTLLALRRRLIPDDLGLGWTPVWLLGYLVFLFVPMVFTDTAGPRWGERPSMLPATLVTIVVFLPIYVLSFRLRTTFARTLCMLGIAGLGYALLPINPFSNTYIIYALATAAFVGGPFGRRAAWAVLILVLFLAQVLALRYPLFVFAVTLIVGIAVFLGNHYFVETTRKRAELKLSHDEVRRLAALAERERIGRDLHDLLGHTLSLVALKSELAGKLLDRDPQAARHEIDEVTRVARDALAQVRRAVTGIRAAGLAAELASAKLLLEADGVSLHYELDAASLPADLETALALTVREAVTNVQRHARAHRVRITATRDATHARLRIVDDGRGGAIVPGNGVSGMRERLEALGGDLRIDAVAGRGTTLEAELPLRGDDALRGVLAESPRAG